MGRNIKKPRENFQELIQELKNKEGRLDQRELEQKEESREEYVVCHPGQPKDISCSKRIQANYDI